MPKVKEDVLKDPILKRIVEIIVKELDPDKIILFGSRARGDYNEDSDYDILVLKRGIKPEERRPLQRKIRKTFWEKGIYPTTSVDVIVQSVEKFDELKNEVYMLYYAVVKEGIVIYEKGERDKLAKFR